MTVHTPARTASLPAVRHDAATVVPESAIRSVAGQLGQRRIRTGEAAGALALELLEKAAPLIADVAIHRTRQHCEIGGDCDGSACTLCGCCNCCDHVACSICQCTAPGCGCTPTRIQNKARKAR